jgi:hypothetical protein
MDENKKSSYFGICQYLATCDRVKLRNGKR